MARDSRSHTDNFETETTGGLISGLLAEEDEFDRHTLWRLGSWAIATVAAVIVALLANQSSIGMRREQVASVDLVRQSQQVQSVAKENQSEARRLASAIETLNSDRDRLYSRVAVLEHGLDSVTGTIARQNPAVAAPQAASPAETPATVQKSSPAPNASAPAPITSPATATITPSPATAGSTTAAVAATAATEKLPVVAMATEASPASAAQASSSPPAPVTPPMPLVATKSIMAPPDPAAAKLSEPGTPPATITAAPMPEVVASTQPSEEAAEPDAGPASPGLTVQRTEFGVDVGGANSLPGLRALWRGLLKSRSNAALTSLRPIIVIKEGSNGLGMQLRLVAGPISDAAAAAKICAGMIENERPCATTVFEGQRLSMNPNEPATSADAKPAPTAKPVVHRHYTSKRAPKDEPVAKPEASTLSQLFGRR